jgi:hypothetical protein
MEQPKVSVKVAIYPPRITIGLKQSTGEEHLGCVVSQYKKANYGKRCDSHHTLDY